MAVDADDVGGIARVRAAGLIAVAGDVAGAGGASRRDVPLTAVTVYANFVTRAEVAALTAVTRIRLRIGARVVVAGLLAHAVRNAYAVLASRRIALAGIADHTAVGGIRLQVDALTHDERQSGATSARTIFAIVRRALALNVATTATIRIVLGILAIVAVAIRQAVHAGAAAGVAQAPRIVAIIAAVAAIVDVRFEVRAAVEASLLPHRTHTLTRRTRPAVALATALTAVVGIGRDICAFIAAGHFTRRARAHAVGARGAERTEEAASAAVCFIRAEFHAADVRTAIDGTGGAHARSGHAHTVRAALVAASAAVVDVGGEIGARILRIAGNLTHRTRGARAGDAHLPLEAIIAALTAVVQIRREIRAPLGTRDLALRTGTSAGDTRCALEAIFAANAAVVVVGIHVDARAAAFRRSGRTSALSRDALTTHGTRIAACAAVFRVGREIRTDALVVAGNGACGTFANAIDARGTGRAFIAARSAVLRIRGQVRAETGAIVGFRRFACGTLSRRTRRARCAGIAALTAIGRICGQVETTRTAIHRIRSAGALAIRARSTRSARNAACAAVCDVRRRIDALVGAHDVRLIGTRELTAAGTRSGSRTRSRIVARTGCRRRVVATSDPRQSCRNKAHQGAYLQPPLKTVHAYSSVKGLVSKLSAGLT